MSRVRNRFSMMPTATGSMAIAFAAACLPACGGKGERLTPAQAPVSSDAGVSVDPCNPGATIETQIIGCAPYTNRCADFENGAVTQGATQYDPNTPSPIPSGLASWTIAACESAAVGTDCLAPNPTIAPSPIPANEGHCGPDSTSAFHMVARGQLRWGPQFYIQYNYDPYPTAGIDISEWDGIAFWMKKGTGPTGSSVFVSLVDPVTDGKAPNAAGVICNSSAVGLDAGKCDQFGFGVSFTDDWQYNVLRFTELKQRGYGIQEPAGLDLKHITMLKFGFEVNDYWDFWVDDISLWREKQ